jgi:hypothetical protein
VTGSASLPGRGTVENILLAVIALLVVVVVVVNRAARAD